MVRSQLFLNCARLGVEELLFGGDCLQTRDGEVLHGGGNTRPGEILRLYHIASHRRREVHIHES